MKRLTLLTTASLIALAAPATAQTVLAPVTVEATRLPTTTTESGTSLSVVTQTDIERRRFRRIEEALDSLPGVKIAQNGGPGSTTGIFIRGIAGDKVVVLIDGVKVNDPSSPAGAFDFSAFDASDIDRIEVLRGAQSVIWGADAIGGVVLISTKHATKPGGSATAFGEYGTDNRIRAGASAGFAGEDGDIRLSVVRAQSDGFPRRSIPAGTGNDDGFETTSFNLNGRAFLTEEVTLFGSARYIDTETDFDNQAFPAFPPTFPATPATDEVSESESFSGTVGFDILSFGGAVDSKIQAGVSRVDRFSTSGGQTSRFDADGETRFVRAQSTVEAIERVRFTVGAEYEALEVEGAGSNETGSGFGLVEVEPVDGLLLTGGLRHDENNDFGGETTYKLSFNYSPMDMLTLRGNYATGFKAPTLSQLTADFGGGPSPDLTPETSEGFEFGADLRVMDGRATLGATYFQTDIEDEIAFRGAPPATFVNLNETEYRGVELFGALAVTDAIRLDANYTYTDASDNGTGARLIRRPLHAAEAELSYDAGAFTGSVAVTYNSKEDDAGGSGNDEWIRVDLAAGYAITESIEIYGRVENLFDEQYEDIAGFNTPGLGGFVGLRAKF